MNYSNYSIIHELVNLGRTCSSFIILYLLHPEFATYEVLASSASWLVTSQFSDFSILIGIADHNFS